MFYSVISVIYNFLTKIRAKTNDDMAEEAKLCFQYATELFKELYAEKKETDQ